MADPNNLSALDEVAFMTGLEVVPAIATPSEIRDAIEPPSTPPSPVASLLTEVEEELRKIELALGAARRTTPPKKAQAASSPSRRAASLTRERGRRRGARSGRLPR